METTIVNLVEPGDPVVICVNGVFGMRMADVATRAGADVHQVQKPWGEVFEPQDIQDAIAKHKPKLVGIVMAETSTGASQKIPEIADTVHNGGAMLVVDAVTSLGGMPVEVDEWNIDAIYSGSQKCLSCPPAWHRSLSITEPSKPFSIVKRKSKAGTWTFPCWLPIGAMNESTITRRPSI